MQSPADKPVQFHSAALTLQARCSVTEEPMFLLTDSFLRLWRRDFHQYRNVAMSSIQVYRFGFGSKTRRMMLVLGDVRALWLHCKQLFAANNLLTPSMAQAFWDRYQVPTTGRHHLRVKWTTKCLKQGSSSRRKSCQALLRYQYLHLRSSMSNVTPSHSKGFTWSILDRCAF